MSNNLHRYAVVFVALAATLARCGGRELRPSEHGLEYQQTSPPPAAAGGGEEMRSFFASTASFPAVELPEAKNISDTWLSAHAEGGAARDAGRDHVKLGLVAASAVCGLTGVVLLAISGVVFLLRLRKRGVNSKDERISSSSAAATAAAEINSLPLNHAEKQSSG